MIDKEVLARLKALEEELEALRRAFQAVLFGDAIEADQQGRERLAEYSISVYFDMRQARRGEPDSERLRRILARAQAIIEESTPPPIAPPPP